MKFAHKISKGSRFNQIYIPKSLEKEFEVGDMVEIRLIRKKQILYSKNLKLNEFKKSLIKQIFHLLNKFSIHQAFIIGSFLSKKDYNDIDIILISDESEEKAYFLLVENFEMNFHIIAIKEKIFKRLIRICPLTRSMLYYFISDKPFSLPEPEIDKNHLLFLLMMPKDLLKIKALSRAFYDSLRRLITIERFLNKKEPNPIKIEEELKEILGSFLYYQLKNNEPLNSKELKIIRKIIKSKLRIEKWVKNL